MLTIDGAFGEGGGQIIRSSLALSLVTGQAIAIEKIRAGRQKPGLMRQHLAAVRAAQKVGRAKVEGAELGSQRLVFRPRAIEAGNFHFLISTAGSATLVAQTVLPALLLAGQPSTLTVEGGTHNEWAPPYDFLARTFLPIVSRMGHRFECLLHRAGFYPAGGGKFELRIHPASSSWRRLDLRDRPPITSRRARILTAHLPADIAQRERKTIQQLSGWDESCFQLERVESAGPGNVVMIELQMEQWTEIFTSFGRRGKAAEAVAQEAHAMAQRYLHGGAAVDEHLADQLLMPLGLSAHLGHGEGCFTTGALSSHAETHIEILRRFLDVKILVEPLDGGRVLVRVR